MARMQTSSSHRTRSLVVTSDVCQRRFVSWAKAVLMGTAFPHSCVNMAFVTTIGCQEVETVKLYP